ncbi:MAG: hypothetical protein RLZZ01_2572 [Actinomycetota bacterium]|jgi:hypothetical protein
MQTSQHGTNTRPIRALAALAIGVSLSACGGGGGNLVEESTEKADAACACEEFGCTTEFIGWFNEVSITQEDDLAALSAEDYDTYLQNSLRAADCQDELR